ncbi:8414_t:CDS:1, partial [Ambispora gerdemannii]
SLSQRLNSNSLSSNAGFVKDLELIKRRKCDSTIANVFDKRMDA